MESLDHFEADKSLNLVRRAVAWVISEIKITRHQLSLSDQNLGEGMLRSSGMPSKNMNIPDYPPSQDDTI